MNDQFESVPLRYIGFAFAIAEAGKYRFQNRMVEGAVGVGSLFVLAHILHAALVDQSVGAIIGALLFELLCSVAIPVAFNKFFVQMVFDNTSSLANDIRMWVTFLSGLIIIPIMLQLVDPMVLDLIGSLMSEANV